MSDEPDTTSVDTELECSACGHTHPQTIEIQPWVVERWSDFLCPECGETTRLSWEFTDE